MDFATWVEQSLKSSCNKVLNLLATKFKINPFKANIGCNSITPNLCLFLLSNFRKGILPFICPVDRSVDVTINFFNVYRHKSPLLTQYHSNTKYQSKPSYTDLVAPSYNQYRPILTQYHQLPTSAAL